MIFTLKEHLDALKEDELRTFQWHLNHVKLAWGPIPRSQLDNATRETTVDKMVQVYGEDGALEMMVSILKMMNRNDQATRLSQARRSSNVGLHLLGSLSSTVKETHRDAECMISVNLSHSTVIFSGPMILDSSDHQLCQNCGTEVERLYLTNTNAPISSVHSPLLSSSSILQQGPAAAPLSGPPVVSNPGVLVQSIVGMPQREINNPLSLTVPQIPQGKIDNGSYESIREPQVPLLLLEKITDPIYGTAPQIPQAKIDNGSYESIREPQVEPLPSSAMSPTTPASLYMQGLPLR